MSAQHPAECLCQRCDPAEYVSLYCVVCDAPATQTLDGEPYCDAHCDEQPGSRCGTGCGWCGRCS